MSSQFKGTVLCWNVVVQRFLFEMSPEHNATRPQAALQEAVAA